MRASFNLVDAPFVPCITADGPREFGVRETLLRAHEILEVRDESPLVTLALHRLLLAVLHRVFGPKSVEAWAALWTAGQFPADKLDAYFDTVRDRFDLFHEVNPFFQTAGFTSEGRVGVNRLSPPISGLNTSFLFSHTSDNDPPTLPANVTARWLVAHQLTAGAGGRGYGASPLSRGVAVIVVGSTVFETLMLNLVRVRPNDPIPGGMDDVPVWERETTDGDLPTRPDGLLDYLTWLPRRIRVDPPTDDEPTIARTMSYAAGRMFRPAEEHPIYDPMMAYRRKDTGDKAIQFDESRALWRDSATLFANTSKPADRPPASLQWLGTLVADGTLMPTVYRIAGLGYCADNAKVFFWRHETLPLPLAYLADTDLVELLHKAVEQAEEVGKIVRNSAAATASRILAPGTMKPDKDRLWSMVDAIAADQLYWSRLEPPFRSFIVELTSVPTDSRVARLHQWFNTTLRPTAFTAFHESAGQLDHSARVLRAVVAGGQQLSGSLARLAKTNNIPGPVKKEGDAA